MSPPAKFKKVRVLVNPHSGLGTSLDSLQEAWLTHWERPGTDLTFQFSTSKEDGQSKAIRALEEGVEVILVVGGDGMVNSIGSCMIGSEAALGVVPAGSGNGFARHFGTPLDPSKAIEALASASVRSIDVGVAGNRPFFVTCGLAWDAALVRTFEKSPIRGVLPYVFAGVYEFLNYSPQHHHVEIDGVAHDFRNPIVFTIANLTQYGGGARIAPQAREDDGYLELVLVEGKNVARVLPQIPRLFDGSIERMSGLEMHRFRSLRVTRERPGPMQLDGELIENIQDIQIGLHSKALKVLVPAPQAGRRRA